MAFFDFLTDPAFWRNAATVALAVLFFGVIIMSHEFGHFIFAKLFKVKVNEFAFGMGPTILSRRKGETKYAWRLLPIGGFVSMEGEDEESESEGAFCSKPVWQRFIIVAAGATVNIIMGFLIVVIMLAVTTTPESGIGTPEILYFDENAVSSSYGLQEGDVIKEIGGKRVFSVFDVSFLMSRDDDGVMDITVKRDGEKQELKNVKFQSMAGETGNTIIFDFVLRGVDANFVNVIKYSALQTATLARMVWLSLFDLVTGRYGLSDLSGPIGTVAIVAQAAGSAATGIDWEYLLLIMALIAVNIGVFNLLPVPALDGGRLFFMIIEMVIRRPVPQKYERFIHAAGLVLLLGFMAVVSMSDVLKLVRGEF